MPNELATLGAKFIYLEKLEVKNQTSKDILNSLSMHLPIAKEIGEERNRYIHDQWIFDPLLIPQGKIKRVKLTSSGLKETTELEYRDLLNFAEQVGSLQLPFANVLKSLE